MVTPAVESAESTASERATPSPKLSFMGRVLTTVISMIAVLPISIRSLSGWILGYLVGLLPIRERRMTILQLKAFLPEHNAHALTPRVFANAGRTALESLRLQPLLTAPLFARFRCPAWDSIIEWIEADRPIIALTGHTGNWDLLAAYIIARGIPLTTVGREARNPAVQRVLRQMREGYGIETIWRSDKHGLKRLMACLKQRRVVAALIDQDTRVESVMSPFFGTPAKTPISLISLGKRCNARFVSAFLCRTGFFSFEVHVREFSDSLSETEILHEYNRRLEQVVRQHPDQWVWFHKRWRTLPNGITLSSREYAAHLQAMIRNRSNVA